MLLMQVEKVDIHTDLSTLTALMTCDAGKREASGLHCLGGLATRHTVEKAQFSAVFEMQVNHTLLVVLIGLCCSEGTLWQLALLARRYQQD